MADVPGADTSILEQILYAAQHYGPLTALSVIGGLIWRGSGKVSGFQSQQAEHARKLFEHQTAIDALRLADAANRVTIAGLATREDLKEVREEVRSQAAATQSQVQSGFETMSRMMGRRE